MAQEDGCELKKALTKNALGRLLTVLTKSKTLESFIASVEYFITACGK